MTSLSILTEIERQNVDRAKSPSFLCVTLVSSAVKILG